MKQSKKNFLLVVGGLFVGAVNSLFGAGGGMLVVPLFSDLQKLEQKKAHATAIITILPICITSAVGYLFGGVIETMPLIYVMIGGVAGGILGTLCLQKIKNDFLVVLFYILMIVGGVVMILRQYKVF